LRLFRSDLSRVRFRRAIDSLKDHNGRCRSDSTAAVERDPRVTQHW
jgi:hypothetical protein